MLGYILDVKMPKDMWRNVCKMLAVNTTTCKVQLLHKFNDMQQNNMFVNYYTLILIQPIIKVN